MKRGFQFTKDDDLKFKTIMNYLFDSMVDFEAHYKTDGGSVILFECDDIFFDCMLKEVPRIHNG